MSYRELHIHNKLTGFVENLTLHYMKDPSDFNRNRFDADLFTGSNHPFEARLTDFGQNRHLAGFRFSRIPSAHEDSGGLENRFAHQDTGHDGTSRIVPSEKIEIFPQRQFSDNVLIVDFNNILYKQKRLSVWYVILNRIHPVYIEDTSIAVKPYARSGSVVR